MKLKSLRPIAIALLLALLLSLLSCADGVTLSNSSTNSSANSSDESSAENAQTEESPSSLDETQESTKPDSDPDATLNTDSTNAQDTKPNTSEATQSAKDSDEYVESESAEADGDGTQSQQPPQTEETQATNAEEIPLYANGAYKLQIIRSDIASDLDKNAYNSIRMLLKEKVGSLASYKSDFVGVGGTPYQGPAILIGSTSYDESISENAKLQDGDACARICNGKYVITFSNAVSASKALARLESIIEKQSSTEIIIDKSWEFSITEAQGSTSEDFNESSLASTLALPKYDGEYLSGSLDAGQGTKLYVKKEATEEKFNAFCSALFGAGFKYYTDNKIGDNRFATYVTQKQIVHVMYFAEISEIRITVDIRGVGKGGFDLPALSDENEYEKTTSPSMTMVAVDNTGYPGGMCFVFRLSNGKFFIIDSGIGGVSSYSSATWLYNTLKELAGTDEIVVAGWLITHIHSDHLGGLVDIARGYCCKKSDGSKTTLNIKNKITIEQLIHNDTTSAIAEARDCADRITWINEVIEAFNVKSVIKAHPGQVLHFADARVTVLASQDVNLDVVDTIDNVNEFSVATRVEFNGKSILFPGDAEVNQNAFMATVYNTHLKSDFLQVTHHGYNLTGAQKLNEYCNPEIALWTIGYDAKNERDKFEMNLNWPMNQYLKENKINYSAMDGNLTFDNLWKKLEPWSV